MLGIYKTFYKLGSYQDEVQFLFFFYKKMYKTG